MKIKVIVCLSLILLLSLNVSLLSRQTVSAQTNQIYWGAWVGNSHIGNYNLLTTFEGQVGKDVSIWDWIQLWNRPQDSENIPNFDASLIDQARNHGVIPMVSWGPEGSDGTTQPAFTNMQDILNGNWDSYFDAWGAASAAWGYPYFVRPFWEFTGSWNNVNGINPWSNGNTPAIFVAAWQHMVDHVRAAGGTQISWVWCPGDVGDSVSNLQSVYPGDNYVDWVGTDIYSNLNQGDAELTNIHAAIPQKPVMIPEIGYTGTNKGAYWNTLLTLTLPNQLSYVKAIAIWEMPSGGLTVVDSITLPSFSQAISSNYYTSNTYSTLNTSPLDALNGVTSTTAPTHGGVPLPDDTATPTPTSTHTAVLEVHGGIIFNLPLIAVIAIIAAIVAILVMGRRR